MLTDTNIINDNLTCHICGEKKLHLESTYSTLLRVASDCVPWRSGGRLGICSNCLCVQNPVDKNWENETSDIYRQYKIYTQSAGNEQGVFAGGNPLVPRSTKIFQQALPYLQLKKTGRLLDIGCANGELLRYFNTLVPEWKTVGFEIDDKRKKEVENITGVEAFVSGSLDKLTTRFDLITLIHVFEHLPYPIQWLQKLHHLLNPNGKVLIQVPNPQDNPYNLLVADHCSHFIMPDLVNIAHKAGYEVITQSDNWVSRELTILISPIAHKKNQYKPSLKDRTNTYPTNAVQWLHDIVQHVKSLPKDKPLGIWGTAIAATWLYSLMEGQVDFFVDEDTNRIGQKHLGHPIYSPEMAPKNSNIYIALTPEIATSISHRWSHLSLSLFSPPCLTY